MAKQRERLEIEPTVSNIYFPEKTIKFISSGCTILDCVLGGGYPLGRVVNIVGDRSTAKTALATEAVINFLKQYPDGVAYYREIEAAFDTAYAQSMGLPLDKVDFGEPEEPLITVEDLEKDLDAFVEQQIKSKKPGIYILDSLDALSDEAEMETMGQAGFGAQKAKALGRLFRKITRKLERANALLIIVSQVRENIGAMFGEKYKRSGGKALDFFASQVMWLAHMKTLKKTINKVERPYGVIIKSKLKKNKVAPPFRECEFPFIFNYGVDDLEASLMFFKEIGEKPELSSDYEEARQQAAEIVKVKWNDIEAKFAPTRSKYGG